MGTDNQYDGIDDFVVRCIRFKARKLVNKHGFPESDLPDLEQELINTFIIKAPQYDPDKGGWELFVGAIIDRAAFSMLEKRNALKRGRNTRTFSIEDMSRDHQGNPFDELPDDKNPRSFGEQRDLHLDLLQAIKGLSPNLQELADRLLYVTVSQVAREKGVSRKTIYRRLEKIRIHFAGAGLKKYIE